MTHTIKPIIITDVEQDDFIGARVCFGFDDMIVKSWTSQMCACQKPGCRVYSLEYRDGAGSGRVVSSCRLKQKIKLGEIW